MIIIWHKVVQLLKIITRIQKCIKSWICWFCAETIQTCKDLYKYMKHIWLKECSLTKYQWKICEKVFSQKHHMKSHVSTIHEGIKPDQCHMWGSIFGQKNTNSNSVWKNKALSRQGQQNWRNVWWIYNPGMRKQPKILCQN
jgi:hypothetical protein